MRNWRRATSPTSRCTAGRMPRWCLRLRGSAGRARIASVSLRVRAGEVLGIYGFLGAGQLELARTLFGMLPAERGRVIAGRPRGAAVVRVACAAQRDGVSCRRADG